MKLTTIVTIDKQTHGAFQRIGTTRKTTGLTSQARQATAQLGVIALHGKRACLTDRNLVSGFDPGIWARCARLREKNIPLFIISPKHSAAIQQESATSGARGVLVKPLVVRELILIVSKLLGDSE